MRKTFSEVIGDYSMRASRKNDAPGNIRAGQLVSRQRGNVLTDEMEEAIQPKSAVVLLMNDKGQFLAVSRFNDLSNMNMPGGGIEPGELPEDAAKRELWEETGLVSDVVEIYREGPVVAFKAISPSGRLRSSDEGIAKWVDYETIAHGQYSGFFRRMIKHLSL